VDAVRHEVYLAITLRRARILRGLAQAQSEREIGEDLCLTLAGVRSHVEDLKQITGQESVRELARWWQGHARAWVAFCAAEGGVSLFPSATISGTSPRVSQKPYG
jgi:DNA-binding CsgD family transcriptional regulator